MPPTVHKSLRLLGLILLSLAFLLCPACTFAGLGMGTMNPRYREVEIRKIKNISPGSQIHVSIYPKRRPISSNELKPDVKKIEEITGIYRGTASTVDIDARVKIVSAMLEEIRTQQSPEDAIQKAREVIRKLENMKLKEMADRVREAVSMHEQKSNSKTKTESSVEADGEEYANETNSYENKTAISRDKSGLVIDLQEEEIRDYLVAALSSNQILNLALLVETERIKKLVPLRRVQQLQVKVGNYWYIGLLAGLAVDVSLILVLSAARGSLLLGRTQ